MIVSFTLKAGASEKIPGPIYAIRNLTASPAATVQVNNGATHKLSDVLRVLKDREPYARALFTGGTRDCEIELALSADDEFDGSASPAPALAPGWDLIDSFTQSLVTLPAALTFVSWASLGVLLDLRGYERLALHATAPGSAAGADRFSVTVVEVSNDGSSEVLTPGDAFATQAIAGGGVDMSVWKFGPGYPNAGTGRTLTRANLPLFLAFKTSLGGSAAGNAVMKLYGFRS